MSGLLPALHLNFLQERRYAFNAGSSVYGGASYLARGAGLTGAADGKKFTLSFFARVDADTGDSQRIVCSNPTKFNITKRVPAFGDDLLVLLTNPGSFTRLQMRTATAFSPGAAFKHVAISADMGTPGAHHLLVNGVSNKVVDTFTDDTLDFTAADWNIGALAAGPAEFYAGALGHLFFHTDYLDLSVASNVRKLYENGFPVDLGPKGERVFGVQPLIYMPKVDGRNVGTGGNFTLTGALPAGPAPRVV